MGATGKWAPCGWKPFSFAMYCSWIGVPSGAVNWNEPCTSSASASGFPAFFRTPCSCDEMPLPVSYEEWYVPSKLTSWSWLRIGIGSLPVSWAAETMARTAERTINCKNVNLKVFELIYDKFSYCLFHVVGASVMMVRLKVDPPARIFIYISSQPHIT